MRWPGRLEHIRLAGGRSLLLDAAHNPAGAEALATSCRRGGRQPLVFAAMRDKDVRGILAALVPPSALSCSRARPIRARPTRAASLDIASDCSRPSCPCHVEDR